jgi:hypothetical protein
MIPSASIHTSLIIFLLIFYSLCSLHASGKKHLFAEFVKRMRDEIEQVAKTYVTNFPGNALYDLLSADLSDRIIFEIIINHQSFVRAAGMIQALFRGVETTYSTDYSSLKTDCVGKNLFFPSVSCLSHFFPSSFCLFHYN